MSFIQLSNISHSFGHRDILKNVNYTISLESRTALCGGNGSGKTTLMKIITNLITPESGEIIRTKGIKTAYLPQSGLVFMGNSLIEEAEKAFQSFSEMIDRKKRLEEHLKNSTKDSKETQVKLEEHHHIEEKLLNSGYYIRRKSIEQILTGLGFSKKDFDKKVEHFSGGWQMRIALAKVLLQSPDILLLDEPTNYLDIEAREWLKNFLQKYRGGVLLVSHDRHFLNSTTNEILELFNSALKRYKGNYSEYEKTRALEISSLVSRYNKQEEEISKINDFIKRFRYNASKASLVQSKIKYLEKITKIEIPENMKKINFIFPLPPHSGKIALTVKKLTKSYGSNMVLKNLDLIITRGEKIVIAGKNGAGKSTLLRCISEIDKDYSGEIIHGAGIKTGYFSQDQNDINDSNTVLEEIENIAPPEIIPKILTLLASFLFRNNDIHKKCSVLSGGERSRLAILKLLLNPLNLLILDEPTSHLDIQSKDILLNALKSYSGTVIFVSHDRYFIENLAQKVLELKPQSHILFHGGYPYYLEKISKEMLESNESDKEPAKKGLLSHNNEQRQEQKKRKANIRRLENREKELMAIIENLEKKNTAFHEQLSDPEIYSDKAKACEIKNLIDQNLANQNKYSAEWETLEEELRNLKS